jgi:putative flippase GtrA
MKESSVELALKLRRFAVVGLATTVVYLLAGYALVELMGIGWLLGTSLAFALVILLNYFLHYSWTFGSVVRHRVAFTRFVVSSAVGFALNFVLIDFLIGVLSAPTLAAQLAVVCVVTAWNFALNYLWVFSSRDLERDGRI